MIAIQFAVAAAVTGLSWACFTAAAQTKSLALSCMFLCIGSGLSIWALGYAFTSCGA